MNNDGVATAFELILEELGSVINELNTDASQKLKAGQYTEVKNQMIVGEKLQLFQDKIAGLDQEWRDSFDDETRSKTVFEGREEHVRLAVGSVELEMVYGEASAKGIYTNGEIEVLPGSTIRKENHKSMGAKQKTEKNRYLHTGKIKEHSKSLYSVCNTIKFHSPSGSAKFIAGCSVNGRKEWTIKGSNKTLGAWIKDQTKG